MKNNLKDSRQKLNNAHYTPANKSSSKQTIKRTTSPYPVHLNRSFMGLQSDDTLKDNRIFLKEYLIQTVKKVIFESSEILKVKAKKTYKTTMSMLPLYHSLTILPHTPMVKKKKKKLHRKTGRE